MAFLFLLAVLMVKYGMLILHPVALLPSPASFVLYYLQLDGVGQQFFSVEVAAWLRKGQERGIIYENNTCAQDELLWLSIK